MVVAAQLRKAVGSFAHGAVVVLAVIGAWCICHRVLRPERRVGRFVVLFRLFGLIFGGRFTRSVSSCMSVCS